MIHDNIMMVYVTSLVAVAVTVASIPFVMHAIASNKGSPRPAVRLSRPFSAFIDEGYLTRVDLAAGARPYLILEVYQKQ